MRTGSCRGAALVEFNLVALLIMLPLLLGIVQIALLVAGYHLLSFAAAEAARAGSVDHARTAAMRDALAEHLLPLHIDLTRIGADGGPLDLIIAARLRAVADAAVFARVDRLSPAAADFADHARRIGGRDAIPNDALEHRPDTPGGSGGRSLQQANLLRIQVRYCHALVVPLIDRVLPEILRRLDPLPDHQVCYAAGRVPLRVASSAPMQSDAWP
jgi:hypothetical protein